MPGRLRAANRVGSARAATARPPPEQPMRRKITQIFFRMAKADNTLAAKLLAAVLTLE
jgi:hypothetical protein